MNKLLTGNLVLSAGDAQTALLLHHGAVGALVASTLCSAGWEMYTKDILYLNLDFAGWHCLVTRVVWPPHDLPNNCQCRILRHVVHAASHTGMLIFEHNQLASATITVAQFGKAIYALFN